ncbi:MAG: haloacid dehalogenase type II [Rhodospirillales bacterium]|nr:haloacid dehalogenase type II [Rhodospirillales bacterium]
MIKAFVFDAYGTLYDTRSVSAVINAAFPGQAGYISPVWRMKQLEYGWLRSMMGHYADFWTVTREALEYTLRTAGLDADEELFEQVAQAYNQLSPYPDAAAALRALSGYRCAILSNGSPGMLFALVRNSGLDGQLEKIISVDAKKVYKPDQRAYALIEEELGLPPSEIVFVSSNGFDICGAKQVGLTVARIERITPAALTEDIRQTGGASPATLYDALRSQLEAHGAKPDHTIQSLSDLPGLAARLNA